MIIRLVHTWRPTPDVLMHPADYVVPRDMTEELAKRAVDELMAIEIKPAPPVPETKAKPPKG